MPNVYDSVVDSFGVDFLSNSNGYYPKGGRKVLFEECLTSGKRASSETYEDCGYKHLYEKHHSWRRNGLCEKFCQTKICEAGKYSNDSVNYKRDNIYQLENEEMSCDNVNINYHDLCEFYSQRNAIDLKLKFNSFTTLISLLYILMEIREMVELGFM